MKCFPVEGSQRQVKQTTFGQRRCYTKFIPHYTTIAKLLMLFKDERAFIWHWSVFTKKYQKFNENLNKGVSSLKYLKIYFYKIIK